MTPVQENQKVVEEFHKYMSEGSFSRSTAQSYYFNILDFFKHLDGGNIPYYNINEQIVREYIDSLEAGNKPQTVNSKIYTIKKFTEFLKKIKNINLEVKIKPVKLQKRKKDVNQILDFPKLLDYIDQVNWKKPKIRERDKLIIKFLYYTGAKTKSILQVKAKDIQDNKINFKDKMISVDNKFADEIRKYLNLFKISSSEYLFPNFKPSATIFKSKYPMSETSVQSLFRKYIEIIDKNLSIIDLRNSFILNQKNNYLNSEIKKIYSSRTVMADGDYLS